MNCECNKMLVYEGGPSDSHCRHLLRIVDDYHSGVTQYVCPYTGIRWNRYVTNGEKQGGGDPHLIPMSNNTHPIFGIANNYAIAKAHWLDDKHGGLTKYIDKGIIYAPARINEDRSKSWSIFIILDNDVQPGEDSIISITTIINSDIVDNMTCNSIMNIYCGIKMVAYVKVISIIHNSINSPILISESFINWHTEAMPAQRISLEDIKRWQNDL